MAISAPVRDAAPESLAIAPRTVRIPVGDLALRIPISGHLTYTARDGRALVDGQLEADLRAAQEQSTPLLRALLDRDTSCGDRIDVRRGRITGRAPALRVTGSVNYEHTVCVAGHRMTLFPRSPVDIDLLLYPIVEPRSLRLQAEVLDIRSRGASMPTAAAGALKKTLGKVIGDRIGEMLPSGALPTDVALKSLSFEEVERGPLVARVELSGSLPQAMLERLTRR